jgi:hypothetical protein
VCTTDNAVDGIAAIGGFLPIRGNSNLAPANGFAVTLFFVNKLENFTDNNWTSDLKSMQIFFFKTYFDQLSMNLFGGDICWEINVFC